MIRAFGVTQVRAAEQRRLAQVPEGTLMQRAAAGLAATCAGYLRHRRGRVTGSHIVLLVGAGNNGGDALWAGQRLARRGARVVAVLCAGSVHAEGLAALRAVGGRVITAADLLNDPATGSAPGSPGPAGGVPPSPVAGPPDLVIDGLVGLGGSPGLREPAADVVARLRIDRPGPPGDRPVVVAVDLPSGVDPDTGETPAAHVVADVTVTFGAPKPCLLLPPASRASGRLVEVDIGLGALLPETAAVERLDVRAAAVAWPVPTAGDDKYRRGVVGVVAGSPTYTGAAVLACAGALRAGVGMVRYVGPVPAADQVRLHWPEVVVGAGRVQAWVLGSGVDPDADDGQVEAVHGALAEGVPCVLDAGALHLLARQPQLRRRLGPHVLLTPHAGELARLLTALHPAGGEVSRGDVEAKPLRHARLAADLTGATVLLKGSTTLVVGAQLPVRSQAEAPAWLATAGAGDVLAGIAGALLAAGLAAIEAGSLAALVHGLAADRARPGGPITAQEVAAAVPDVVADLFHRLPRVPPRPALGD